MDNQLPPQQLKLMHEELAILTATLAEFKFNDPANDTLLMRQHAHLAGQRTQLLTLLSYDEVTVQTHKDTLEARLSQQFQQPTE